MQDINNKAEIGQITGTDLEDHHTEGEHSFNKISGE